MTKTTGRPKSYSIGRYCWETHYQSPFDLGDGETIFASAYSDSPFRTTYKLALGADADKGMVPDVGFYLDDSWAVKARHLATPGLDVPGLSDGPRFVMYDWPDYGVPGSMQEFDAGVRWVHQQVKDGNIVETGCFAAHGRTGTFLAALLILKGMQAAKAIAQVRDKHCAQSIEVLSQKEWLYDYDELVNGRKAPRVRKLPRRADKAITQIASTLDPETGRRLPESVLNELDEDEAYEQWLRLNTLAAQEATYEDWCDICDLPNKICTCHPYEDGESDLSLACINPPCYLPESCTVTDCFEACMKGMET